MHVLTTGGSGFLGRHVVERLLENSSHNLILLVGKSSDYSWIKSEYRLRLEFVTLEELESKSKEEINKWSDLRILHMATEYGRKNADIKKVLDCNLALPIALLEFACSNQIQHFISIDSYFNKERNSYTYLANYSKSKKALTLWFPYFSQKLRITNVVLEHIYGPFDSLQKFVPSFILSALNNFKDGITLSPGEQIRDFIYVEDVASALVRILEAPVLEHGFERINLGTGIGTSIRDFGREVCEILKIDQLPPFGTGKYRENEIYSSIGDDFHLEKYNWSHTTDLRKGLEKTIQWIRENS